jgi:hypothetical protein
MSSVVRRKYLSSYAEPEARLASGLHNHYAAALVVPAQNEVPSLLDGFAPAMARAPGRVLLILVVNATDAAPEPCHATNQLLLETLRERLVPRQELVGVPGSPAHATLCFAQHFDVLLIDRASAGRRLPPGEGVGLARRIGTDIALGACELGAVASPWLSTSDADATLPDEYFLVLQQVPNEAAPGVPRAAIAFPFWHEESTDHALDRATSQYEISLRYYTLGLAAARSRYAYHSLGSTLSVQRDAYAEVRGFPRRLAGEDFHLLSKLAKVGSIHRPPCAPVRIASRVSERVPFGTGPRVLELISGQPLRIYHPRAFELLGAVQRALGAALRSGEEEGAFARLSAELGDVGTIGAVSTALEELQAFEAVRDMFGSSGDARVRLRRFYTWFDALKALRFIHAVEVPAGLPRLPLAEALAQAPFVASALSPSKGVDLSWVRRQLFELERELPADVGVDLEP